ncbi:MAG: glycosyltransferase family 1 protein [Patescibacteria group bacterium]
MIVAIDASRAEVTKKTGVEYYSYYLIKSLISVIPKDVKVILYSRISLGSIFGELPNNWQNKVLSWPPKFLWTQLRLCWQANHDKLDILFIPSHVPPLLYCKPTVTTIHDISWKKIPKAYTLRSKLFLNIVTKWVFKKSAAIITISDYSKQEFKKYYPFSSNKVVAIYLGPTLPVVDTTIKNLPEKYFLILGRVELKKNIITAVQALAQLQKSNNLINHKIVLIGRKGVGGNKIFQQIKKLNLNNQVIYLNWQPAEVVSQYLSNATALLFPGAYEGFGLPVLDAWAHHVPVIASNAGALPEVIADSGLLAEVNNVSDWQAKLKMIIDNENIRQNLINRGRQRLQLFSWQQTAEKTWQALNLVVRVNPS